MSPYQFFKMAAMAKSTTDCGFKDGTGFRKSKSIFTPNFDQLSQSTADLLLLLVSKNN